MATDENVPGWVIKDALTEHDFVSARALFEAYAATLPVDLSFQNFDAELKSLPGKYSAPAGALLIARDLLNGSAIGCVGLRPLDDSGSCEMKRLFIVPEARGRGLGRALVQAVLHRAKMLGYSEVRLDTLPSMTAARRLYEQAGFERIGPYYAPTPAGTVFMALRLQRDASAPN